MLQYSVSHLLLSTIESDNFPKYRNLSEYKKSRDSSVSNVVNLYHFNDDKLDITEDDYITISKSLEQNIVKLITRKKYLQAIRILYDFIQNNAKVSHAYYLLAKIFYHVKIYSQAMESICRACFLNPSSIENRILRREIEIYSLQEHILESKCKVKAYEFNNLYEELNAVQSIDELEKKWSQNIEKKLTKDFYLLSVLGECYSLDDTMKYYDDYERKTDMSSIHNVSNNYFSVDSHFPFTCKAKDHIPSGTVILSDIPFAISPLINDKDPEVFPSCLHCLKSRPSLDQVIGCPLFPQSCPFTFCTYECLMKNVHIHKLECNLILDFVFPMSKTSSFSVGFIILVLRVLFRSYFLRMNRSIEYDDMQFFIRLHSFVYGYKKKRPWLWNSIHQLAQGIITYVPIEQRLYLTYDDLVDLICVLHSHILPIRFDSPGLIINEGFPTTALGICICHNVCNIGHSCIPTCSYHYSQNGDIVVKAIQDIPMDGIISISYTPDSMLPTYMRKNIESSWKILTCSCARCRSVSESGRNLRGQVCINCVRGIRNPISNYLIEYIISEKEENSFKNKNIHLPKTMTEKDILSIIEGSDVYKIREIANKPSGWMCDICGIISELDFQKNDCNEEEALAKLKTAINKYNSGQKSESKFLLENLVKCYENIFSRNHYVMYNAYLYLSSLYRYGPGKDHLRSLMYITRAITICHNVVSQFHFEKVHLYRYFSDSLFNVYLLKKKDSRGLIKHENSCDKILSYRTDSITHDNHKNLKLSSIEALWISIVNAWYIFGVGSPYWISGIHRLRHLARYYNHHSAPYLYKPKVLNMQKLSSLIKEVLSAENMSDRV